MKKLFLFLAAAFMATTVSAQTVVESKTFDNFYIGLNGGFATKTTHNRWLKNLNSNVGLRVGRYFTPVFGLALESNLYFSNRPYGKANTFPESTGTFVRGMNTSLLGTVNMTNWFCGYQGEPRDFEVIALYGMGWGHSFSNKEYYLPDYISIGEPYYYLDKLSYEVTRLYRYRKDNLSSKLAVDFAFNFGDWKEWQLYIEPAMIWALNGNGYEKVQYNVNKSAFQLNCGIVYKFRNSTGEHNFKIADRQNEIDELNAEINRLRQELGQKPTQVVREKTNTREVRVDNLYVVTFAQGSSELTAEAKYALNGIREGSHVQIVGTASPEGGAEWNQQLSQARADVVANYLKNRAVVVDEAVGRGVQGTTSNRLAVVFVK